jgi:predicted metal-dependent HD superfamily phosphohydrolase
VDALHADLLGRWRQVELRCRNRELAARVGAALVEAWAQPHRRYHDLTHLQNVLAAVDELGDHAADPFAVELAAWYHDVVYDGRPEAEERSAERAERELPMAGLAAGTVAEVARLVRLTVRHNPGPDDRNGAVLCDADLAILAADPLGYATYAAAVRQEYAHVPDADFRVGRAAILRDLLARPTLFRTPLARARWEGPARANVIAELALLEAPPPAGESGSGGGA